MVSYREGEIVGDRIDLSECVSSFAPGPVGPLDLAVLGKQVTKDEQQRRAEIVMRILDGETARPVE